MADNTQIETPTTPGANIATDEIAGAHHQRVKITLGADGADGGPVSSANPMPVYQLAGDAFAGYFGHQGTQVTGTTQTTDTTLLTNGDAVGSLITFADIARANGKSFWITGVKIACDKKSITPQFRLHLFTTNGATLSANNAAFQTRFADYALRIRTIELPALATPADATNSTESRGDATPFPLLCFPASDSRTIYGALELVSGAYTPTNPVNYSVSLIVEWN